jgi:hypothetical protein
MSSNNENHRDISGSLLRNILQTGGLDYGVTMSYLMQLTNSRSGQFFEKSQMGTWFICKYTTDPSYVVSNKYEVSSLPYNQYAIYYRNEILAIISLENPDPLEDLTDDCQARIHHSICVGIVMKDLRETKYSFTLSVCNVFHDIMLKIAADFDEISSQVRTNRTNVDGINSLVNDLFAIIFNVVDFLEIDTEKVRLETSVTHIPTFIIDVLSKHETIWSHHVSLHIEDNAKQTASFDSGKLRSILMSILKRLTKVSNLHLNISLTVRGLVCSIFSRSPSANHLIVENIQAERISIESLDIFVAKRLCEIMKGQFIVNESGVTITVAVGDR